MAKRTKPAPEPAPQPERRWEVEQDKWNSIVTLARAFRNREDRGRMFLVSRSTILAVADRLEELARYQKV